MGTIIGAVIVVAIVALIIRNMLKDHKAGKHMCGGDCGSCGGCHHDVK